MYNAEQAVDVGLLDRVVGGESADVIEAAIARASELASRNADAYGQTKLAARAELIKRFGEENT
jgi:enoyl-CoA hydratase/carnithine racemase